ncbi:hypothetical protein BGX31_011591 [Mortierella sp. GBA43]|nr:hypothetical protein BGX31_011591 [Mortierella sp. GBA43]
MDMEDDERCPRPSILENSLKGMTKDTDNQFRVVTNQFHKRSSTTEGLDIKSSSRSKFGVPSTTRKLSGSDSNSKSKFTPPSKDLLRPSSNISSTAPTTSVPSTTSTNVLMPRPPSTITTTTTSTTRQIISAVFNVSQHRDIKEPTKTTTTAAVEAKDVSHPSNSDTPLELSSPLLPAVEVEADSTEKLSRQLQDCTITDLSTTTTVRDRPSLLSALYSRVPKTPLKKAKEPAVMRELMVVMKEQRSSSKMCDSQEHASVADTNNDIADATCGAKISNGQDNSSRCNTVPERPARRISFSEKVQYLKRHESYRQRTLTYPSAIDTRRNVVPALCQSLSSTSISNKTQDASLPLRRPTFMISASPPSLPSSTSSTSLDVGSESTSPSGSLRASFPECLFKRRSPSPARSLDLPMSLSSSQDRRRRSSSAATTKSLRSESDTDYASILEKDSLLRQSCDSSPVQSQPRFLGVFQRHDDSDSAPSNDSYTTSQWDDASSFDLEVSSASSTYPDLSLQETCVEKINASFEAEWAAPQSISYRRNTREHDISFATKRLANLELMDTICPNIARFPAASERRSAPIQDYAWSLQIHQLLIYLAEQADLETKLKRPSSSFLTSLDSAKKSSSRAGAGAHDSDWDEPIGLYEQILRDWISRLDQVEGVYDNNPWLKREVDKIRWQQGFRKTQ